MKRATLWRTTPRGTSAGRTRSLVVVPILLLLQVIVVPRGALGWVANSRFSRDHVWTQQQSFCSSLKSSKLPSSDNPSTTNDDNSRPVDTTTTTTTTRDELERQKSALEETLDKVETLRSSISSGLKEEEDNDRAFVASSFEKEVMDLEATAETLTRYALVPPPGLSMEEYASSIRLFLQFPFSVRWALCESLGLERDAAAEINRIPEIVAKLYGEGVRLTPQRLRDSLKSVQTKMENTDYSNALLSSLSSTGTEEKSSTAASGAAAAKDASSDLVSFLQGNMSQQNQADRYIESFFSRMTRKEGRVATESDLKTLVSVLDKTNFVVSGTDPIPGGFIVRGRNVRKTGSALIADVDARLPKDWPCQVSYIPDVSNPDQGDIGIDISPVLVLFNKDFTPQVPLYWYLCTAAALCTAFLFSVGVYGGNELVAQKITDSTAIGDFSTVDWFNGKVGEVLLPLAALQALHELGHRFVGWNRNIEVAPPILLPFYSVLPFTGAKTDLRSSPANRTALFDFAYVGPLVGIISSLVALALGLQLTLTMDQGSAGLLPSLPVSVLRLSNLGGTIVDYFFGGAEGFVTQQDPATAIPLHPFAIAGFAGLMMNAFELLPLGSSDGGRLSQALFGRTGQSVVGGLTWTALLVSTAVLEPRQVDYLVGAWVVYNIVHNDMEIPCRDEVEEVNIPRFVAAMFLWGVAILTLVPM